MLAKISRRDQFISVKSRHTVAANKSRSTVSTSPPVFTDIGEGSVLDASEGLLQGVGEPRQLHGLPQLGVLVTDRVVPHRQLGPLHRV